MRKSENWQTEKLRGSNELICSNIMLLVSKIKKTKTKQKYIYSDLSFVSIAAIACLYMLFCSPKGFLYSVFSLRIQVNELTNTN